MKDEREKKQEVGARQSARGMIERIRSAFLGLNKLQYELARPEVGPDHFQSIGLKTVEADGTMPSYLEAGNPKSKNKYFSSLAGPSRLLVGIC